MKKQVNTEEDLGRAAKRSDDNQKITTALTATTTTTTTTTTTMAAGLWGGAVPISPAEKLYLCRGIDIGLREDGRALGDYRAVVVDVDCLPQAAGSCRVKIGRTDVLVGIKTEIAQPTVDAPDEGLLKFFVEAKAAMCPELAGRAGEVAAAELTLLLSRCMTVDSRSLAIVPAQQCWCVFVDVLILSSDGSLVDAAAMAVFAALKRTKLPKVTATESEAAGGMVIEVSDDPFDVVPLRSPALPVCLSLTQVSSRFLVDASLAEETCAAARLTVAVDGGGMIVMTQKAGLSPLRQEVFFEMLTTARALGLQLYRQLTDLLASAKPRTSHSLFL